MRRMTTRQKEVLDFIGKYTEKNGRPPTIQEVADKFTIKSSTAFAHIKALITKGKLTKSRSPRSLKLIKRETNVLCSYFVRQDEDKYYLMRYDMLVDKEEKIATFEGFGQFACFMDEVGYGRVEREGKDEQEVLSNGRV